MKKPAKAEATAAKTEEKRTKKAPARRSRVIEGVGAVPDHAAYWRLWVVQNGERVRVDVDNGQGVAIGVWPIADLSVANIRTLVKPGTRVIVGYLDSNQRPAGNSLEFPIIAPPSHAAEVVDEEEPDLLSKAERITEMIRKRSDHENAAIQAKTDAHLNGLVKLAQVYAPQRSSSDDRFMALLERMDARMAAIEAKQMQPVAAMQPGGLPPGTFFDPASGQVYTLAVREPEPAAAAAASAPTQQLPFQPGVPVGDQMGAAVGNLIYTTIENFSKSPRFQEKLAEKLAESLIKSGAVQAQPAAPEEQHVNGAAQPEGAA